MNILGIAGSPRRGGNTEILLDAALDGARSAGAFSCEKIILENLDFNGCVACGRCRKNGTCLVKDGMQGVYRKFKEADAVIIASPIFFGNLTGRLKMMIDRFHCSWIAENILRKPVSNKKNKRGIFICVAGDRKRRYFTDARNIIKFFFNTAGITYYRDLYCPGFTSKGEIRKNKIAMKRAFLLGASLVKD